MMNNFEKALVDKITELYMDIDVLESERANLEYDIFKLKDKIRQLEDIPEECDRNV